jgi:acetoacetyl-CoA reductase/3-oxoacyl-[acyl-carrier protein] reductase
VSGVDGLVSLQGRVALVTGASGGIGSAVCRLFRDAGARVLASDLPGAASLAGVESMPCDLGDAAAVDALTVKIAKDVGRLDAFVHCAGIVRDAVIWKMDPADWSRVMAVNLDSAFLLLRGLAPLLRQSEHGRVILVASINGERGKLGQANYAASKAGLIALAKTAARELGRSGVCVNALAPGLVSTPMTKDLPADVLEAARRESVLGRIAVPENVARVALFLASDLARHVTGQVLRVDGGQLIA